MGKSFRFTSYLDAHRNPQIGFHWPVEADRWVTTRLKARKNSMPVLISKNVQPKWK